MLPFNNGRMKVLIFYVYVIIFLLNSCVFAESSKSQASGFIIIHEFIHPLKFFIVIIFVETNKIATADDYTATTYKVLLDFYRATNIPYMVTFRTRYRFKGWNFTDGVAHGLCRSPVVDPVNDIWQGITCTGNVITEINTQNTSSGLAFPITLSGTITSSIGLLTSLTRLNLVSNALGGAIPTSIGGLTALTYLRFANNQFNGIVPIQIGSLVNLYTIDFSNTKIKGSIPSTIGYLTKLKYLKTPKLNKPRRKF